MIPLILRMEIKRVGSREALFFRLSAEYPVLTFATGGTYFVEFQAASRDTDEAEEVVVAVDGTTIADIFPTYGGTFATYLSSAFTIPQGNHSISFAAVTDPAAGNYAALIDNVQVVGQAPLAAIDPVLSIRSSYNGQGLLDTVSSYDASAGGNVLNQVKNLYNGFGQLVQQYQNPSGAVVTGTGSGHSLSVQYAYDTGNTFTTGSRLISMTYPSGQVLYYNYGSTGSLNSVISRLDNMVGSDDNGGTTTLESYQYLGLGTVVQRIENEANIALTYIGSAGGDGGDIYRGLDRFGRVIDQKWVENASGSTLDEYSYTYDADSNVLTKDNIVAENASNSSFDQTYTYDNLNQLTSAYNGTNNSQSYTLDALGNITGQTNGTSSSVTSTFNAQNQLVSDGGATLGFDADGNTTTDDQGRTELYDSWDRLIAVNDTTGAMIASYSYDGMGRRISQSSPGTNPILMFYDAGGQLLEQDISSSGLTLQGQYVWSAGAGYQNALVLRDFAFASGSFNLKERTYALQDANWNVTALVGYSTLPGDTDGNGSVNSVDLLQLLKFYTHAASGGDAVGDFNHDGVVDSTDLLTLLQHNNTTSTSSSWIVIERIAFSPYGVMSTYTPSLAVNSDFLAWNVGFQGMLYDAQTGFNYTLSRVYEASTGRFLTVDPAHADGMDWYRGDGGNPINSVDPSGLDDEWRLDMSDHGGPHIQKGDFRYDAETLEPITHGRVTPPKLTATDLQEMRASGIWDKVAKRCPESVFKTVAAEAVEREVAEEAVKRGFKSLSKAAAKQMTEQILRRIPLVIIVFVAVDTYQNGAAYAARNAVVPVDVMNDLVTGAQSRFVHFLDDEQRQSVINQVMSQTGMTYQDAEQFANDNGLFRESPNNPNTNGK